MFIFCMILRCVVHVTISFVCWKGHLVSNDTQNLFHAYMCVYFFLQKKKKPKKSKKTKSKTDFLLCLFLLTCYLHQHEYHRH